MTTIISQVFAEVSRVVKSFRSKCNQVKTHLNIHIQDSSMTTNTVISLTLKSNANKEEREKNLKRKGRMKRERKRGKEAHYTHN